MRHAALHARAQAFPLGFGVLTRQGVTTWRHTLAQIAPPARPFTPGATPTTAPAAAATLPAPVTTELVNALAAIALAGT